MIPNYSISIMQSLKLVGLNSILKISYSIRVELLPGFMGYTHLAIYTLHRYLCSTENCETISCYLKHCHEKESVTLEKRIRIKEGRHRERDCDSA